MTGMLLLHMESRVASCVGAAMHGEDVASPSEKVEGLLGNISGDYSSLWENAQKRRPASEENLVNQRWLSPLLTPSWSKRRPTC